MKTKVKIIAVLTVLGVMFSLTACSKTKTKWNVESVYCESLDIEAESVYRYNVKQIELLADSDVEDNNLKTDKVLKVSTDFKYFYSKSELSTYYYTFTDTRSIYMSDEIPECQIAPVFDKVTYKKLNGSTYQAYYSTEGKYVKVRVIIDGLDTVYRPALTEKNGYTTLTYNMLAAHYALSLGNCSLYKKEVAYVDYKADYDEYLKAIASSVGNDSGMKQLEENFEKKYKYAAILKESKVSFNTAATPIAIEYSGEKK